jgi:DNA-binding transcriptional ArsR family regulator
MRLLGSGRLKALERGPRAGGQALSLAADPLNRRILRGMASRIVNMEGEQYTLSDEGHEVLFVAATIERWLGHAPDGPIEFESAAAERAVAALLEGWSAAVVHGLAREPMTSAELNAAIDGIGGRRLRRQLSAMHGAGLVEALGEGGEALYAMADWLRRGIAPLIAAARLERDQGLEGSTPVDGSDVEAGFRMALALVELPEELSGVCSLRLKLDGPRRDRPSGVTARIERGKVVSCEAGFEQRADAWALASLDGWLNTVIDPDAKAVRTGGDAWLTDALVSAIHHTLFGVREG